MKSQASRLIICININTEELDSLERLFKSKIDVKNKQAKKDLQNLNRVIEEIFSNIGNHDC